MSPVVVAALAQGVRIDRPAQGTLQRGYFGLVEGRGQALVLALAAVGAIVLGLAIYRRIRRGLKSQ